MGKTNKKSDRRLKFKGVRYGQLSTVSMSEEEKKK